MHHAANTADAFRDFLRGAPKVKFHEILTVPVTWVSFQNNIWLLIRRILGQPTVWDQLPYLRRTPKPNNMSMETWLNRIEAIDALFPYM